MTLTPSERKLLQEAVVFAGHLLAQLRRRVQNRNPMDEWDVRDAENYGTVRKNLDEAERILFRSEEPE